MDRIHLYSKKKKNEILSKHVIDDSSNFNVTHPQNINEEALENTIIHLEAEESLNKGIVSFIGENDVEEKLDSLNNS